MYRLEICTIVFAMNRAKDYWVMYSFYSPTSSQTKSKPFKQVDAVLLLKTRCLSSYLLKLINQSMLGVQAHRLFSN